MASVKRAKSEAQNHPPPQTVEDYIAIIPQPARSALEKMRATIRSVVPSDATEVISYAMPAFKRGKVLVWYAAFSNHCSLFPTASVIDACKNELQGFTTSKGTIQFPLDRPLPTALIRKIVKLRVQQNPGRGRSGSGKGISVL